MKLSKLVKTLAKPGASVTVRVIRCTCYPSHYCECRQVVQTLPVKLTADEAARAIDNGELERRRL